MGYITAFEEGSRHDSDRLGGKGAGLAEMTTIGLPVPPGFTVNTQACRDYLAGNMDEPSFWEELRAAMAKLEAKTGKVFGRDLVVSIRSGAKFSMPGMMDTILNVGVPPTELELHRRLKEMYERVTGEPLPSDPWEQVKGATRAVWHSWNGERARAYREHEHISHDLGTAVNVQTMVFGNADDRSGTGVLFTRNPATGSPEPYGEYLARGQGEDVVSGAFTPEKLDSLEHSQPELAASLLDYARLLERHYKNMQDIEFTVESGKIYVLQTRNAKRSAAAAVRIAVDMMGEGLVTTLEALKQVTPEQIEGVLVPQFVTRPQRVIGKGIAASPGAALGKVALTSEQAIEQARGGEPVILVREETSPEDVTGMIAARGILTRRGGTTSHAAVVARGMGRPAVVGATFPELEAGSTIAIDGSSGEVFSVGSDTIEIRPASSGGPGMDTLLGWADGLARLHVYANADTAEDARRAREWGAQGIGLVRTEHMFFDPARLPSVQAALRGDMSVLPQLEEFQFTDFVGILRAMDGLPVTIRLLDAPLHEFLGQGTEQNPMLGHRGSRMGVTHPDIYSLQARAIYRAYQLLMSEGLTPMPRVMLPLIMTSEEFRLIRERIAVEMPGIPIGTMIETPRAAIIAAELVEAGCEFLSFGTNDLTQLTYGISRDDVASWLPAYREQGLLPFDPFVSLDREGVGYLIKWVMERLIEKNLSVPVGICGEHGGDPQSIPFFEEVGLISISCSPGRVPAARLAAAQAVISGKGEEAVGTK